MSTPQMMMQLLGGRRVLKRKIESLDDLIDITRKGIPYQASEILAKKFAISQEQLVRVLNTSVKTLTRHKVKGVLSGSESDRLMRLAKVASRAEEVLGSEKNAAQWLQEDNYALGGRVPLNLLDTEAGSEEVLGILGRIEQGIFS